MEADYDKMERRSRIRTARARQINPQVGRGVVEEVVVEVEMMEVGVVKVVVVELMDGVGGWLEAPRRAG